MTIGVITGALKQADPGALLRLQPGVYVESVVLDRRAEIVGEGPPGAVVIEGPPGLPCLRVTAPAVLRNLTLRGQRLEGATGEYNAVEILADRPTFEDCTMASSHYAVCVRGPTADPTFRRCLVRGDMTGLAVGSQARATVEDCAFTWCKFVAAHLQDGAAVVFQRCRFSEATFAGAVVQQQALGLFEGCEFVANPNHPEAQKLPFHTQLLVSDGGEVRLTNCQVHDGFGCGVHFSQHGRGRLTDCRILGHPFAGVQVGPGSEVSLEGCLVRGRQEAGAAKQAGVVVQGGSITLQGCDITGNSAAGFAAVDGAVFQLLKCRLTGNYFGVAAVGSARGSVQGCDLRRNTQGPLYVEAGCQVHTADNNT